MLPSGFNFSQSSLQDFEDCPRRFQLRYVDQQVWPAVQAEPFVEHEQHLERGSQFHRLVERHVLGIPESVLTATISDEQLLAWWQAYLGYADVHGLAGERYPEYTLAASVGDARVVATYDLVVVQPEQRVVIFDWKTYARMPGRAWFEARAQTRVYPYVAVASGRFSWLKPAMVSLVYWTVASPGQPVTFLYDDDAFERDRAYVADVVGRIRGLVGHVVWPLTADQSRCRFCVYRSLCDRGEVAGRVGEEALYVSGSDGGEVVVGWDAVEDVGF